MRRLRTLWQWILTKLELAPFLCDHCKYDSPSTCRRPGRPNVTVCRDFRRR